MNNKIIDEVRLRFYDMQPSLELETYQYSKVRIIYGKLSQPYLSVVKTTVTPNRIGKLLAGNYKSTQSPLLVIATYISPKSKEDFKSRNISYIETNGNMFLLSEQFFINVEGKPSNRAKVNQANAIRGKSATKIINEVVKDTKFLDLTYDEMAKMLELSKGTISQVIKLCIDADIIERKGYRELSVNSFQKLAEMHEELNNIM